ncbi:hypothetical protein NE237_007778 [Protea cynaroides]|uniref:Uncharacterized protein n=1 Tax=Protea cynaroides TaxID=273540 RepID=A0A9Q0KQU4_9MAGN|nr:hypothetical protein NE237_007778 [Protea cynaroides]
MSGPRFAGVHFEDPRYLFCYGKFELPNPNCCFSDAVSNEFRKVKWVEEDLEEEYNSPGNINRGIVLIVGFMPGLKVSTIQFLRPIAGPPPVSLIDKFVLDIKDYATSVSGCTSPAAILMFAIVPSIRKLSLWVARMTASYIAVEMILESLVGAKNTFVRILKDRYIRITDAMLLLWSFLRIDYRGNSPGYLLVKGDGIKTGDSFWLLPTKS